MRGLPDKLLGNLVVVDACLDDAFSARASMLFGFLGECRELRSAIAQALRAAGTQTRNPVGAGFQSLSISKAARRQSQRCLGG
jgi:hypothetical protein